MKTYGLIAFFIIYIAIPYAEGAQYSASSFQQKGVQGEKVNIVDLVSSDPSLSLLKKALEAADLAPLLGGSGPFTLFAPNDTAFAKLSPNALEDLFRPENKKQLIEILKFHIVPGKINPAHLKTMKLKTIEGKTLEIKANSQGVFVNNGKVIEDEIDTSNGIIYVIDSILQP
jgi:uncharacterized surface protein with fasciclin (FAS1) repeats